MFHFGLVIPRLVLEMKPKYDFSIPSGGDIHLQCTINNPESLLNVTKGGLILKKDETTISGQGKNEKKKKKMLINLQI